MRRFFTLALIFVMLPSLLGTARASHNSGTLPGDFMGMVVRDPHYEWRTNPEYPGVNERFFDAMGHNLRLAGVKWIRIEFRAEDAASDMPGKIRLEQYQYMINTVAPRYGLKVLALLATQIVRQPEGETAGTYLDPELLDTGPRSTHPIYGGGVNDYARIWLDNAFLIASTFPYDKTTGAGIAAYEVLNEENRYLGGGGKGLSPERVAELTTKFYRIFKQNGGPVGMFGEWRHDVNIILGGMHPGRCDDCRTSVDTPMTDREYLDAVYRSSAFQSFRATNPAIGFPVDGIGYHPYPMEMRAGLVPEETGIDDLYRVPERLMAMRRIMTIHGDERNKFWVTEIGDRGAPGDADNQRRQADFLRTIYWMLWQQRDIVNNVFWFKYEDFAVTPETPLTGGPENWGIVRLRPRAPTPDCPTCEYAHDGSVEVFKQSYVTYANMAQYGTGLRTYHVYVPLMQRP